MLARCSRASALLPRKCTVTVQVVRRQSRRYLASAAGQSTSTSAATAPVSALPLADLARDLNRIAPHFEVDADDVQILQEPCEFYEALKVKILASKKRVYLATLYIGKTEVELVETLRIALRRNPTLNVSILTDYFRGTRESPSTSCASLLAPLVAEFGAERVEIRLWHTPNLTGLRERLLPKRINEGWGLQHMKLYGCDDELMISGANLSNDYFTNRQDRYHVFRSMHITDYYHRIYRAVCSISYLVSPTLHGQSKNEPGPGYAVSWPKSNACTSPQQDPQAYIQHTSSLLSPLIKPSAIDSERHEVLLDNSKAIIYPLFQLTPLLKGQDSTELPALTLLLQSLASPAFQPIRWTFTAGYFNMTPGIRDLLFKSVSARATSGSAPSDSRGTVITAHPEANGFYGSKGISGMLPPAYTLLARRFLRATEKQHLDQAITLLEWRRGTCGKPGGWTYHAKGLWITLPNSKGAAITLVGSSNYTQRSHTLDLEANALILTRNQDLQQRLAAEERHLQDHYTTKVDMDEFARTERRVGWHVRVAMWIVSAVGGAL